MRFLAGLTLVALAQAQAQQPLGEMAAGWFDKAKSFVGAVSNPVDAGAAAVAHAAVTPLTLDNWKNVVKHSGAVKKYNPPEAWMVYVSGGNKSCRGHCDRVNNEWNQAATLLAADPSAPHLASIDCDAQEVLCGAWGTTIPSVWFFLVPQPSPTHVSQKTVLTIHNLNMTTSTAADITRIHTRKTYLATEPYTGWLHPFDGWLAQTGLTLPFAWFLYGFSKIPPWAMMILVSMSARNIARKRLAPQGGSGQQPGQQQQQQRQR